MTPSGEDALITRLSIAFAPFTCSAADATRIRGALARHKSLNEITAKRSKDLRALPANTAARASFDELNVYDDLRKSNRVGEGGQAKAPVSLRSHLELLRLQRLQSKLEILERHTGQLEHESTQDDIFNIKPLANKATVEQGLLTASADIDLADLKETAARLTKSLELAVLQAQHQHRRSKKLLNEVKERHSIQSEASHNSGSKLRAISATRDELVRWIEEHIANETSEYETIDKSIANGNGRRTSQEMRIRELYDKYVAARERLLKVSMATISPLPVDALDAAIERFRAEHHAPASSYSAKVLPFVEKQIIPAIEQQNANLVQHAFITTRLAKERLKALEALGHLSDESHLLHMNTSTAEDISSRLKPTVVRSEREEGSEPTNEKDALAQRAETWALADLRATQLSTKDIQSHVLQCDELLEVAEGNHAELVEFLRLRQEILE